MSAFTLDSNGLGFKYDAYVINTNKTKNNDEFYKNLTPERIIVNNRTTVIYFPDGSKSVVKCAQGEEF